MRTTSKCERCDQILFGSRPALQTRDFADVFNAPDSVYTCGSGSHLAARHLMQTPGPWKNVCVSFVKFLHPNTDAVLRVSSRKSRLQPWFATSQSKIVCQGGWCLCVDCVRDGSNPVFKLASILRLLCGSAVGEEGYQSRNFLLQSPVFQVLQFLEEFVD